MSQTPRKGLRDVDFERVKYLYEGEVKYCDLLIGELLKALEERELLDSSLIVVTADHGEGLWDHRAREHGVDLHEESIRVPLIIDPPSEGYSVPARFSQPVSLVDLAPTILAAVGLPQPDHMSGTSFLTALGSSGQIAHASPVYSEMDRFGRSFDSIRIGSAKLIRKRRSRMRSEAPPDFDKAPNLQFFDLQGDPREGRNLVDQPSPERRELVGLVAQVAESAEKNAVRAESVSSQELDPATLESLRALGYLGDSDPSPVLERKRRTAGEESQTIAAQPGTERFHSLIALPLKNGLPSSLEQGFFLDASDPQSLWMAKRGALQIKPDGVHTSWRVQMAVDLSRLDGKTLTLKATPSEGRSRSFTIRETGLYIVEGELPARSGSRFRLRIDCDRGFPAEEIGFSSETPRLCLQVTAIGLS